MKLLHTIWRVWIKIEGEFPLLVPTIANPDSFLWEEYGCSFTLVSHPCCTAIAQGYRFRESSSAFVGMYEGKFSSTKGVFRARSGGYTLSAEDLEVAQIGVYYVSSDRAIDVQRVEKITGNRQIVLSAGASAEISPDLCGKELKLTVQYPRPLIVDPQPIEEITLHGVGLLSGKPTYIQAQQSKVLGFVPRFQVAIDLDHLTQKEIELAA